MLSIEGLDAKLKREVGRWEQILSFSSIITTLVTVRPQVNASKINRKSPPDYYSASQPISSISSRKECQTEEVVTNRCLDNFIMAFQYSARIALILLCW